MTTERKQAGFAGGRLATGLLLALLSANAEAAQAVYKPKQTNQAPKSLEELIPDLPPANAVAPATSLAPSASAKAKAAPPPVAKSPPPPAPVAAPEPPKQAYRVYTAPALAEEDDAAPPARTEPMPPLDVAAEAVTEDKGGASLLGAKDLHAAAAPATLTNQFFPLLPLNAGADATPQLLPLASNHDIAADHTGITRAILFVHDMTRNVGEGLTALMTLAGAQNEEALILAPQFPLGVDVARFASRLPDGGRSVARWSLIDPQRSWQVGGNSVTGSAQMGISSFTAIDLLLLYLADRNNFPALRDVTITGHGMGADFTLRYAAIGQAPDLLQAQKIAVRFLAANPNSFPYLTESRPVAGQTAFVAPDTTQCPAVNDYPYGLDRLTPSARRLGASAIRARYPERRVMVVLSDKIAADALRDDSCAALAQGKTRLERGRNFERYLSSKFGDATRATQAFAVVPGGDYDPVALFGSYCGTAMLFGEGNCPATLLPRDVAGR